MQESLGRWHRLERFARWKQNRLRLMSIPDDAMLEVINHLDDVSFFNLMHAYLGDFPDADSVQHVARVPSVFHASWLVRTTRNSFHYFMHSIMMTPCLMRGLYFQCTLDWSCFSGTMPNIVATVVYDSFLRPTLHVNEETLLRNVYRKINVEVPMTRCTLHYYNDFVTPRCVALCHQLYPAALATRLKIDGRIGGGQLHATK